jgi:hypothetical protein
MNAPGLGHTLFHCSEISFVGSGSNSARELDSGGIQDSRDPPSRLADEPSPAAWPPMVICRVAIRHSYGPVGV